MLPLAYLGIGLVLAYFIIKPTTANTIKDKQKAYEVLANHSEIPGFTILKGWLDEDNFTKDVPYVNPPDLPATITIGSGKGATEIKNVELFLRDLTAEGLNKVTSKAIRSDPKPDSPAYRTSVLTWITADVNKIHNYDQLVKDLNAIDWISTNPQIPVGYKVLPRLDFNALGKTIKKADYPYFLLHATAGDILEMTDSLLNPHDSTLEDRQFTFLLATTSATGGIPGFAEFVQMLQYNGFVKSPQQFNIPKLMPNLTLGGSTLTVAELTQLFKDGNNSDINQVMIQALNGYDPSLPQRIASLATFKAQMNNFKGEPGYPGNFETVYNWLVTSGFVTKDRKFTPINNPPQNFTARSFAWFDIPDVNSWLSSVDYTELNVINAYSEMGGLYMKKYYAYRNCVTYVANNPLDIPSLPYSEDYTGIGDIFPPASEFIPVFSNLYNEGLMYSPSRLPKGGVSMGFRSSNRPSQLFTNDMLNADDTLLIAMWIGGDPKGVIGILNSVMDDGSANPFFNQNTYNLALEFAVNLKLPILYG